MIAKTIGGSRWGVRSWIASSAMLCGLIASPCLAADGTALPTNPAELYQITAVHTFHLSFTPEAWEEMEPKGGPPDIFTAFQGPPPQEADRPGPGGPPAGGPPPRGPGGSGGPGGFRPSSFIAPLFLNHADQDKDKQISREEFSGLAERWFDQWDRQKRGSLKLDDLRTGWSSVAEVRPPGGGPGGPGGRGPGMNLQGREGGRNGLAAMLGVEFKYVSANVEFNGTPIRNVAVRYKGNGTFMTSRQELKKSLKLDFNKFEKGRTFAGVDQVNLHSNVTDASWMNEVLSHRLYRDAGVPAPRTAYARVYVTVPGKYDNKYVGLFSVVEDVDEAFASELFKVKRGAVYKPVTPTLFADLGDDWAKYNQTYDPKTKLSDDQKKRVIEFARFLKNASDDEFAARLDQYLDLDNFSRYMAVTVYLSTLDSILSVGQNYYMYLHPETNRFHFIPWDLDHSFGQFFLMGDQSVRNELSIHRPWSGENRFLERVFKVEAFKKLYIARMEEFSGTIFEPGRIAKQVDEIAAAIRDAVKDESRSKLARFDRVVEGKSIPLDSGPSPEEENNQADRDRPAPRPVMRLFLSFVEIKPIKAFVNPRIASIKNQLAGKSQGKTVGPPGDDQGGQGGPGGQGRQRGFGPGAMMGNTLLTAFDADRDFSLSRQEFVAGFEKFFNDWTGGGSAAMTEEQLRQGIDNDLSPFPRLGSPPGN